MFVCILLVYEKINECTFTKRGFVHLLLKDIKDGDRYLPI